jgi:hypothetical protein
MCAKTTFSADGHDFSVNSIAAGAEFEFCALLLFEKLLA